MLRQAQLTFMIVCVCVCSRAMELHGHGGQRVPVDVAPTFSASGSQGEWWWCGTLFLRLGSKCLYLVNHLTSPHLPLEK